MRIVTYRFFSVNKFLNIFQKILKQLVSVFFVSYNTKIIKLIGSKMNKKDIAADREIIDSWGTVYMAKKLGYSRERVQNWKVRGIPAVVKLENPKFRKPKK